MSGKRFIKTLFQRNLLHLHNFFGIRIVHPNHHITIGCIPLGLRHEVKMLFSHISCRNRSRINITTQRWAHHPAQCVLMFVFSFESLKFTTYFLNFFLTTTTIRVHDHWKDETNNKDGKYKKIILPSKLFDLTEHVHLLSCLVERSSMLLRVHMKRRWWRWDIVYRH